MRIAWIECCFALLVVVTVVGSWSWPAAANVVLQVDVSNPRAVTFASTGANAAVDDSSTNTGNGVTLIGLFTSPVGVPGETLFGNLTPAGTTVAYGDLFAESDSNVDLNLFSFFVLAQTQTFSTTTPAFSGAGTANLEWLSALLPPPGTIGDIRVGGGTENAPLGAVIGQYEVVPLPLPALLLASGLVGLAAVRRLRLQR